MLASPWRERVLIIDVPSRGDNGTVDLELQPLVNDTDLQSECFITRVTDSAIDCQLYRLSGQMTVFVGGQASDGQDAFADPSECPIPLDVNGECDVNALSFSYSDVRNAPIITYVGTLSTDDIRKPTEGGTAMVIEGANFGQQIGDVEVRWYRPD